jgi:hypothetical protein
LGRENKIQKPYKIADHKIKQICSQRPKFSQRIQKLNLQVFFGIEIAEVEVI